MTLNDASVRVNICTSWHIFSTFALNIMILM